MVAKFSSKDEGFLGNPQNRLHTAQIGRTPKGAYSSRGRSRHLLETAFSELLLRTLLRTLFYCKTHSRPPSQNPFENPFPRTLPRTFSEPFLERCVAVRPLRRAPNQRQIKEEFLFRELGSRLPGTRVTRPYFLDSPLNRSGKEELVFGAMARESQECVLL